MSEVVNCPKCERKLRVPEELLGKKVKCPTCSETFTATAAPGGGDAPPPPMDEPAPRRPRDDDIEGDRPSRRPPRRDDDRGYDDEPRARPRRRPSGDYAPHRGTMILIFGILSVVFCNLFGPVAWIMGNTDMKEIREGRMDPEGESLTNIGRILGIVGSVLLILGFICGIAYCGIVGMVGLGGAAGGGGGPNKF